MIDTTFLPTERIPPQAIEAETSVLGAMLMSKDVISEVVEFVKFEDFYRESHKKIFNAIISLWQRNEPVDLITLSDELNKLGQLSSVGGATYLTSILSSVPTPTNAVYYAKIIAEKAALRSLVNVSSQILTMGYQQQGTASDILDRAEQMIFNIVSRRIKGGFTHIKEYLKPADIEILYTHKPHITGVSTGFTDLDEKTSGFQPSDLIIIAGRPSMGKTSIALSIAQNAAVKEKVPVGIFSLEMSQSQLVLRLLCSEARVDAHRLRTGRLSKSDLPRISLAAGALSDSEIYLDDTASMNAIEMKAKARRLKAQYNIGLLIIDYLQLMEGTGRFTENRQQEISEISRFLKGLAKELNIPVVALSQLSRATEIQRRKPQLSDLRESGAIEQDADLVLFVYREEYYKPTEDNEGIAEIIIGKQRNGPTGSIHLAFLKSYAKFENLAKTREE
ncbi:replicative DNA helicase [bacterium]|nr:replicative DNA helicase [bacterium]MBU1598778.1 replicative DNA helicase [bacterium]